MPSVSAPPRTVAPWVGLGVSLLLIGAAMAYPVLSGVDVHVRTFPPLHALWGPRLGPGTVPAILLGAAAVVFAGPLASRLPWGRMLLAAFAAALAWMLALATVDGLAGIGRILEHPYEYLQSAREITDIGALLRGYIARIPDDAPGQLPTHLAGHPPGAVLFFVMLVRLGLGSGLAAGLVVTVVAATTPVAVLLTLRRLGAEGSARKVAPFLVFGSAAIWMCVSADAMFGAVAAWGLFLLACGATARRWAARAAWGAGAGLLLGYCVMLSYGLPLLGVLALAVIALGGRWWVLPWAIGAAIVVVAAFAVGGFAWWQAYPVLVERYYAGIASRRPYSYWVWGNLAALSMSAGPIVGAGVASAVAVLVARLRRGMTLGREVWVATILCLAATLMVALADLSGMSKAEVERIWLPFVPWLLIGTALLPPRWRRGGLALQIVFALVAQHLLRTGW